MSQEPYLNEKVFGELFKKYYRPICFMVFNFVQRMGIAQDLTNDAYAKMWECRETTFGEKEAKAFLFITAKNYAFNMCRHFQVMENRQKDIIDFVYLRDELPDEEAALYQMIRSEFLGKVYSAIEKLAPEQKKVIEACYINGLDIPQAVKYLNKNFRTLKEQKRRGLCNLRLLLNNEETIKNYYL